jgi:hypothetical protein
MKTDLPEYVGIVNLYGEKPKYDQKTSCITHPARINIVGKSASGKTVLAVNIVTSCLHFDTLTIYSSNTEQPLFKKLIEMFTKLIESKGEDVEDYLHVANHVDRDPNDYDPDLQHLVIIDDLVYNQKKTSKETKKDVEAAENFFQRGRMRNISVVITTQRYFNLSPDLRENQNFCFVFNVSRAADKNSLFSDLCEGSMTKPQFMEKFNMATKKHGDDDFENFFSVLDPASSKPKGLIYRRGLIPYSLFPEEHEKKEYKYPSVGFSQYKNMAKPGETANYHQNRYHKYESKNNMSLKIV